MSSTNMKFSTPKGCSVLLVRSIGYLLVAYFGYGFVFTVSYGLSHAKSAEPIDWISLGMFTLLCAVIITVGLGLIGMFPSFRIVDNGVQYKYFFVLGGVILWDEMINLVEVKHLKGTVAVVISRNGYGFFRKKGLFFNSIYATFVGEWRPVLFLSSDLSTINKLVDQIRRRSPHLSV